MSLNAGLFCTDIEEGEGGESFATEESENGTESDGEDASKSGSTAEAAQLASMQEEDGLDNDEYGQLGPTLRWEDGGEHRQPDALGALMEAKFGTLQLLSSCLPVSESVRNSTPL